MLLSNPSTKYDHHKLPIHYVESDTLTIPQTSMPDVSSYLFSRSLVSHFYKEANIATDGLISYALSLDNELNWLENLIYLLSLLLNKIS